MTPFFKAAEQKSGTHLQYFNEAKTKCLEFRFFRNFCPKDLTFHENA